MTSCNLARTENKVIGCYVARSTLQLILIQMSNMKGSFTNGYESIFVETEISTDMDTPSTPARDASNRSDIPITVPSKKLWNNLGYARVYEESALRRISQ